MVVHDWLYYYVYCDFLWVSVIVALGINVNLSVFTILMKYPSPLLCNSNLKQASQLSSFDLILSMPVLTLWSVFFYSPLLHSLTDVEEEISGGRHVIGLHYVCSSA